MRQTLCSTGLQQGDPAVLAPVLAAFGCENRIALVHLLQRQQQEHQDGSLAGLRLIFRVDFFYAPSLVVRVVTPPKRPVWLMENQAAFCQFLHQAGIPCPRQHLAGGRHCLPARTSLGEAIFAVEDFEAGELTRLDAGHLLQAGSLLGRMHSLSLAAGQTTGGSTIFDIRGRNDIALAAPFFQLKTSLPSRLLPLYQQVETACRQRLKKVREALLGLPLCAVQGDLSNLFFNQKGLGVFDFDNCGDVHPVSDLVLEGLMLSREMDYAPAAKKDGGDRLFAAFLTGYEQTRPLSAAERSLLPDLYALCNCLYMMQVKWGPDSLAQLLAGQQLDRAERLLLTMRAQILSQHVPGMPDPGLSGSPGHAVSC